MNSRVGDLFPSNFEVFFRCVFFEAPNHIFCKQCDKVTPKGTQKDNPNHQIHGCTTSQNMWYLQYGSHILQFWMCFGIHFFHTVLGTLFFHHFFAFWEIRCQNSPKNGRVFYAENLTNSALSPKSSHEAPRRAQGLPNDAKILPKGPKMMLRDAASTPERRHKDTSGTPWDEKRPPRYAVTVSLGDPPDQWHCDSIFGRSFFILWGAGGVLVASFGRRCGVSDSVTG